VVPGLPARAVSLAVSRDSKLVAAGMENGLTLVFDLTATDPARALHQSFASNAAPGPIMAVAFLDDPFSLLTGSRDGSVQLWKVIAGAGKSLTGHANQVYSVSWSVDGKQLATGAADKTFRQWNVANAAQVRQVSAHANVVYAAVYSPKGDLLVTGGDDKLIKYWSAADGKELRKSEGHGAPIYSLSFHPDGARLASGSVDKTVRIWNVADGKELHKLDGHTDDVYGVAFSPDGKRLASVGYGGNLLLWDVSASKLVSHQKVASGVMTYGLAWSPDGKHIAVAGSDNKAYILQVNDDR
jgi:WD40 repeat protein